MSKHSPKLHTIWQQGKTFLTGIVIGLCCVTPALAAPFDLTLPESLVLLSRAELLLYGSLLVLAVGLLTMMMRRKSRGAAVPEAPDLRWWRNAEFQ